MSKVQLPKGWQSWPEAQQMELLSGLEALVQEREAGRGPWLCDREVCDGKPHPGRRNPHSRSEQRPPPDDEWDNWLLLAGRGFGKTRTGAEWVIEQARTQARGALVGATAADTRDILVEGESGILACAPVSFRPVYEPSKRRVTYPNGSVQTLYSADEPDRLRGPQHHYAWCIAAGEPVLTERGWTAVEDVRDGERVATRKGWLPSTGAVRTKTDAELIEVVTESGERVTCTPDHRIATGPTTWTEARNLVVGDTISVWNSSTDQAPHQSGSNGGVDVTTGRSRATTAMQVAGSSTGTSGLLPTGTSPSATSSTTLTTTRPTTTSATSSACRRASTSRITHETGTHPAPMTTLTEPRTRARAGSRESPGTWSATTVGAHTSPQACGRSTAHPSAVPARVVSVSRLRRRSDVYDIGVPGGGEFIVGGIVVHNCDELAAWRRLQYAWDMLQMGLRLGAHPRACITTTPRPLPLVKQLVKSERSAVVRGSTYDNLHNLAPTFRRAVLDRYAGTVLGRQELDAEILEDLPGALVRRKDIEDNRVDTAPDLDMILVGVDPSGTGTGDEAGIVVVGRGTADRHAYVLADLSGQLSARQTGLIAWQAFYDFKADALVYEDNFGKQWLRDGLIDAYADHHQLSTDMRAAIKDERTADTVAVPSPWKFLKKVTAQHGKKLRAQPVAMRYEQGRVHHVGIHAELEDQETTWNPDEDGRAGNDSPDRIDALVHAVTYLLKRERAVGIISTPHARGIGRASGPVRPPLGMNRRFGA